MQYFSSLLFLIIAECSSSPLLRIYPVSTSRQKREEGTEGEYNLPPTEESHNPYSAGTNPIPFQPTINGLPSFPYVNQFSQGLDVDPGDIFYMKGHLNVPVPGWGDMKGKLMTGPSHIWENFGYLLSPTNLLNKQSPADFADVRRDAVGGVGESGSSSSGAVPVANLPTGWQPVKCRPPLCNPYVHSFDTGVQVEPGDDRWIEGSLDLPIKSTAGDHFPLDGSLYAGTMPIQALYGHVFSPVNSPKGNGGLLNFKRFNPENNRFSTASRNRKGEGAEGSNNPFLPPPPPNQSGNSNNPLLLPPPPPSDAENSQSESSASKSGPPPLPPPFRPFFPTNESGSKSVFVLPPSMQ